MTRPPGAVDTIVDNGVFVTVTVAGEELGLDERPLVVVLGALVVLLVGLDVAVEEDLTPPLLLPPALPLPLIVLVSSSGQPFEAQASTEQHP